ncbi:alkaline phosphatase family protein [Paenibacillus oenotherae]|uniref:Alkaline phosphatase family protein n=1 Tax=Paenibacillus oenotherae TaxID=1435645 RepID=A0ABS7DAG8_9BACL|nr:alkaline phosphatase family protein [Paenibacillus oenotherae]MBW7476881.1 alkaline phosphatase family protein [Paenibacillus oenotherae]
MKQASSFEIVAARCWNLLNEGKPFTPIFAVSVFLLYRSNQWLDSSFWTSAGLSLLLLLPLFALCYCFDFPLFLRNYLWFPVIAALLIWEPHNLSLYAAAIGLYFFFTVFFWGTFYYRMRIGTSWWNFKRFWKLVLKNSDSTSGNAQEQLPKLLLLLFLWNHSYRLLASSGEGEWFTAFTEKDVLAMGIFTLSFGLYSWILHANLFDWKPKETAPLTNTPDRTGKPMNEKVIVIVIDGMRKERFEEADAPFLKKLRQEGTEYTQMETVYPARTVVCFSSMFTGAYPRDHGIRSNMVWKLGIRVESIFDSLRKVGKKGRLLGIAHLIDSMGDDVESVTAVMHNDKADRNIIDRAKKIMAEQNPDLFVVQMIAVDQTGHSMGVLYDEYLEKIAEADRLVEEFVGWLDDQGMMNNTTLIICADHGQADGIGGHGHLDEGERFVPFFLHGKTIRQGIRIDERHSLISMAPTLAYLLGAPYPSASRGQVLTDAFKEEGPHET